MTTVALLENRTRRIIPQNLKWDQLMLRQLCLIILESIVRFKGLIKGGAPDTYSKGTASCSYKDKDAMRLYEYRQSSTSPLKYHLELKPEEFELVKDLVMGIINRITQEEENKIDQSNCAHK